MLLAAAGGIMLFWKIEIPVKGEEHFNAVGC